MTVLQQSPAVNCWADKIRAAWQSSFDGIMECGRLLVAAKDQLDHGQWLQLIDSELPFKANTAQRLMKISTDERLTNAAHAPFLPRSRETLYELTKLPTEVFEQKIADGTIHPEMQRSDIVGAVKKDHRATREMVLAGLQSALPKRKYGVIYADPEWRFEPYSRETGMDRAPENHYPTSTVETICARPVRAIAAPDCALFLWATVPMLAEAFCVLDAWGFARFERNAASGFLEIDKKDGRYVSSGSWTKYKPGAGIGMGHWFRVDHEILLVATRGNVPCPAKGDQARSVFDQPASRIHSEKPELVAELIESYFPNLPKIELNARRARPGWDCWGNEAPANSDSERVTLESIPPPPDHPILNTVSDHGGLTGVIHGAPLNDQNGGASTISEEDDPLAIPAYLRRTGAAA